LAALKIGVTAPNSSSHFFVLYLMAKAGLAPGDVSFVGVGGGERAVNAMKTGEIDAISNLDPVINGARIFANRTEPERPDWLASSFSTKASIARTVCGATSMREARHRPRGPPTTPQQMRGIVARAENSARTSTEASAADFPWMVDVGEDLYRAANTRRDAPTNDLAGRVPVQAAGMKLRSNGIADIAELDDALVTMKQSGSTTLVVQPSSPMGIADGSSPRR
jgi:NMT1-like family